MKSYNTRNSSKGLKASIIADENEKFSSLAETTSDEDYNSPDGNSLKRNRKPETPSQMKIRRLSSPSPHSQSMNSNAKNASNVQNNDLNPKNVSNAEESSQIRNAPLKEKSQITNPQSITNQNKSQENPKEIPESPPKDANPTPAKQKTQTTSTTIAHGSSDVENNKLPPIGKTILTKNKDNSLSYEEMSKSKLIKMLKEKDDRIKKLKKEKTNLKNHLDDIASICVDALDSDDDEIADDDDDEVEQEKSEAFKKFAEKKQKFFSKPVDFVESDRKIFQFFETLRSKSSDTDKLFPVLHYYCFKMGWDFKRVCEIKRKDEDFQIPAQDITNMFNLVKFIFPNTNKKKLNTKNFYDSSSKMMKNLNFIKNALSNNKNVEQITAFTKLFENVFKTIEKDFNENNLAPESPNPPEKSVDITMPDFEIEDSHVYEPPSDFVKSVENSLKGSDSKILRQFVDKPHDLYTDFGTENVTIKAIELLNLLSHFDINHYLLNILMQKVVTELGWDYSSDANSDFVHGCPTRVVATILTSDYSKIAAVVASEKESNIAFFNVRDPENIPESLKLSRKPKTIKSLSTPDAFSKASKLSDSILYLLHLYSFLCEKQLCDTILSLQSQELDILKGILAAKILGGDKISKGIQEFFISIDKG